MNGNSMTQREQVIYDFVVQYREMMHFSPSMRVIADGVGLYSVSTVHKHVHALVEKGWFMRYEGKYHSIIPCVECAKNGGTNGTQESVC